MALYDLVIHNVRVVRPGHPEPAPLDIAVTDGVIQRVEADIDLNEAGETFDGRGLLAFPGLVDAHQHWGIYNPLDVDTESESRAAAQGGVTTGITYIRTGQYYLNRGGPYADFMPEVRKLTDGRAHIDYAFHVAPMMRSHIDEIPDLVSEHGIPSFKIFMFYGSHGLHGRSSDQSEFLMIPEDESYDYAHFEFVMRGVQQAREQFPELADDISLSLHCETAEIMSAYTRMVEESGQYQGLEAYHRARPPHSEGLAVTIASYLAHETRLANINLLHLSSRKAIEAAMTMAKAFPHVDFRREVTAAHLTTDITNPNGVGGKVNPPIRPSEDVDALWEHLMAGNVDWVVSDHACCRDEKKFGDDRQDVFVAKSGFGGAEFLLPVLLTEGRRRGLDLGRVAELTSSNAARRFGLHTKGQLAQGYDADVALVDPDDSHTIRAADSDSTQEYSPFEGMTVDARVLHTFLRGQQILAGGELVGQPRGSYLHRPTRRAS